MTWFIFSLLSISTLALAELTQQYILHNNNQFETRASGALTLILQAALCVAFIVGADLKNNFANIFKLE